LHVHALGEHGETLAQVQILDLNGRVIHRQTATLRSGWNRLPLSVNLPKGMFWVRVNAEAPALLVR
jgi:hypothetical protein